MLLTQRPSFEILRKVVLAATGAEELEMKTEMYVRTCCQGTVDLICDWIMGIYDGVTPEELSDVFENCLPVPLRQFLL